MLKGRIIALGIVGLSMILCLALLFCFFIMPSGIELDIVKYPVRGIDISKHTGIIDFERIKDQNVDFVFLKATEGIDYVDERFETNYKNAHLAGIPKGAYHFFRFERDGKEQANHFLRSIAGKKFELPLVLDIEEWGNPSAKPTDEITVEIEKFLAVFESERDELLLYSNESSYRKFILGKFDDKPLWICSFSDPPNVQTDWLFWQHSHKGKLEEAEGWVDLNVFNGTREDWMKYLANKPNS